MTKRVLLLAACLALLATLAFAQDAFRRVDPDEMEVTTPDVALADDNSSAAANATLEANATAGANATLEANATEGANATLEANATCVDEIWEDADTTCADHLEWSQCGESWMQGWCKCSCAGTDYAASEASVDPDTLMDGSDYSNAPSQRGEDSAADSLFADDNGFKSYEECERESRSLLNNFGRLLNDEDIMSCASGAGSRCCRGLNRYLGEGSNFYGCPCYGDLYNQAMSRVPAFAKSIVENSLRRCKVPTPMSGCLNVG